MTEVRNRLSFGGESLPSRLVRGDNLQALADVPENSVDLVYIDPPFATGSERRGRDKKSYSDKLRDPNEYIDWLGPRLREMRRVLKDSGSIFVHVDQRTSHYLKVFLDSLFGRERFINEIIWCYSVGGRSRRSFGRKHDTIFWYGKAKTYAFYPNAVRIPRRGGSHMRVVTGPDGQPVQEKTDRKTGKVYRYPVHEGKVPEDWWTDIETLNRSDAQRTGWPTQKPEKLLQRIIRATTVPGDLVLDAFSGSGTTAAVALAEGRRFLAFDESPEAIEVASTRLRELATELQAKGKPPADIELWGANWPSESVSVSAQP